MAAAIKRKNARLASVTFRFVNSVQTDDHQRVEPLGVAIAVTLSRVSVMQICQRAPFQVVKNLNIPVGFALPIGGASENMGR